MEKNTLKHNNFHIHNSEKITELTSKTKKWWWF